MKTAITRISLLCLIYFGLEYSSKILTCLRFSGKCYQKQHLGKIDALEYWSAYKVLKSGADPYSSTEMFSIQEKVLHLAEPIMMWNPPWTLLAFKPVLQIQSFEKFALIWFFLSILSYICACNILITILSPENKRSLYLWVTLLSFSPFLSILYWGQISAWLLLGLSLTLKSIQKPNLILSTAGIILLSLKLHIFIPLVAIVIDLAIRDKNLRPIILKTSAILLSGLACYCYFNIQIFSSWLLYSLGLSHPVIGTASREWFTTNLPALVQNLTGIRLNYICVIFGLTILNYICYRLLCKKNFYDLATKLVLTTTCFLPFSPFIWFYDYILFVPALILSWSKLSDFGLIRFVLIFQLISLTFFSRFMHSLSEGLIILIPLWLILIFLILMKENKIQPQHKAMVKCRN